MRAWYALVCFSALPLGAQVPSQEDLDAKARREIVNEGLEMREVRESSAKDAGEALAKIDGITKLRKAAIANDIVLRGFSSNDLNVLIDGVRVYGACPGHMDPAAFHVDFAEVERIELTKGGFDASRQGGMGGTLNILRKRPGPGLHLKPTLQTGSFGFYNPSITGSAGDERLEFLAGYSYRTSAQFRDAAGRRMTHVGGYLPSAANDGAFAIHTGWTNFRFSPAPNHSGELTFTRQHGSSVLYPYLSMDSPYDIADRASANYDFRAPVKGVRTIGLRSYYTRVRHWMTDERRATSTGALDTFSMATFAKTRTTGGQANVEFHHGINAGIEAYQRNWDAVNSFRTRMMNLDQHIIPNVNTTFAGAYVTADQAIGRFRFGGGARLDTAQASVRSDRFNPALFTAYKGGMDRERRDTNTTGNLRAAFSATGWLELFTGVASTVRIPDAQERFLNHRRGGTDWVGDPSLDPARNNELNVGATIRRGRSYVKLLAFSSNVDGYVVVHNQARRTAAPGIVNLSARSYANVDADLRGGEFSYGAALSNRWVVSGGMGYTRATKTPRPEIGILDRDVAEIPPVRGRTSLRYGTRKWFAEAEGLASSRQSKVDFDLREQPTAGFFTGGLKGGIHTNTVTITGGIDNVANRLYYEHLSFQRDPFRNGQRIPEPGRTVYLNISYGF